MRRRPLVPTSRAGTRSTIILPCFPHTAERRKKLRDDEIIELIYERLPNRMQGDLQRMNDFDINETNLTSFREALKRLELSYQLEKKSVNPKKAEKSKKDKEKSNGKQSGKKRTNSTNDSSPASAKKPCLLHGTRSHTTEECKVVKEQISSYEGDVQCAGSGRTCQEVQAMEV